MEEKKITITKEAYEALASHKSKDESFSELILRTHKKKGDISRFIGAWEHIPNKVIEGVKKDIERMNKNSMKRVIQKVREL